MPERKVALVTGGERGIGWGIVQRLIDENWNVFIAGIDEAGWRLRPEATTQSPRLEFYRTDVGEEEQVAECLEHCLARFGKLDGLVLNAGIASPARKSVEKLGLEEWQRVIDVNLTSAFLFAKYASPFLRKTKGGIVAIASTRAYMSEANTFAYSASKGGLVALIHSLACSLGPEIRANSISPGWIHTGSESELSDTDHRQHPVGRVGGPEDIASMVAYLLSDASGFITGQDFVIDGGMTKKMIYST